jgi:hypothetical protein
MADLTADLAWLIAAGIDIQVGPCYCGPDPKVTVKIVEDDPGDDVEFHGCATVAEGIAKARQWAQEQGIGP